MSLKKYFAVFASVMLVAPPVLANVVVIQPASIVGTSFTAVAGNPGHLIDQSGLSENYDSLSIYQSYILDPPVPTHAGFLDDNAFRTVQETGYIDFSLGGTFFLTNIALWNGVAMFGLNDFHLFVSMDDAFAPSEKVGSFSSANPSTPNAQSFEFAETLGAFVRLEVTMSDTRTGNALGEVAFGGMVKMSVVPEPASAALLALGLAGIAFRRRPLR